MVLKLLVSVNGLMLAVLPSIRLRQMKPFLYLRSLPLPSSSSMATRRSSAVLLISLP